VSKKRKIIIEEKSSMTDEPPELDNHDGESETEEIDEEEIDEIDDKDDKEPDEVDLEENDEESDDDLDTEESDKDDKEDESDEESDDDLDTEESDKDDKEDESDEESDDDLEAEEKNDRNRDLHSRNKENNDEDSESEEVNEEGKDNLREQLTQKVASMKETSVDKARQYKDKAIKGMQALGNFIIALVKILINPITWIIVAVVLIIMVISGLTLTLGKNDFNELCGIDGVGSVLVGDDVDDFTRQSAIVSWLTSTPFEQFGNKPMTREQAIGVMGNLIRESYGANPYAIQGDHSITSWQTCDNNCVLDWGTAGGKAIGIIQWDSGRRVSMVNFAIEQGTQWYDLNTQLRFLKKELDSDEGRYLVNNGFLNPFNSIADTTTIWNRSFERSADDEAGNQKRIDYAESFAQKYVGGGGLATHCIGGMGIDTTNLVQLAIESAWPTKKQALVSDCSISNLTNCGKSNARPAYLQARIIAEQNSLRGPDNIRELYASCDRFVATMVIASGTDLNFPWGATTEQGEYLKDPENGWKEVSCQDRQPGDVLWRDGHIMLYVGIVDGQDSIASASATERTGAISKIYCSGRMFHADGSLATGYRKVN